MFSRRPKGKLAGSDIPGYHQTWYSPQSLRRRYWLIVATGVVMMMHSPVVPRPNGAVVRNSVGRLTSGATPPYCRAFRAGRAGPWWPGAIPADEPPKEPCVVSVAQKSGQFPPVMPTYNRADVAFERGEGVYLYAVDGRRFLDFACGIAV